MLVFGPYWPSLHSCFDIMYVFYWGKDNKKYSIYLNFLIIPSQPWSYFGS